MKAFITGITGQDGSYLAELLLSHGYTVHGLVRRSSNPAAGRNLDSIRDRVTLHLGNILDQGHMARIFDRVKPDVIFNLAAQSHVGSSHDIPGETYATNGQGAFNVMLAASETLPSETRLIQACTSDMFEDLDGPLNELTPIRGRNAYALGKIAAYEAGRYFRQAHNARKLDVINAILFNHESPRRPETFVTRKVTKAVAAIYCGLQDRLQVGNWNTVRDWGFAGDTVRALHLLSVSNDFAGTGDYVVATGRLTTLAQFIEIAFNVVSLDWQKYTETVPHLTRLDDLRNKPFGDSTALRAITGWEPVVSVETMIEQMVRADIECAKS